MNKLVVRSALVEPVFDYASLPASKRRQAQEEADAIRRLLAKTAANVVQIGLRLRLIHGCLGRKHFQAWLRAEFCWSQSVASNYMRAAACFGGIEGLAQFQPGALYVLARRKVPDSARQEAVRRALAGELITKSRADEIAARYGAPGARHRRRALHLRALIRQVAEKMRQLPVAEQQQLAGDLDRLLSQLRTARPAAGSASVDAENRGAPLPSSKLREPPAASASGHCGSAATRIKRATLRAGIG